MARPILSLSLAQPPIMLPVTLLQVKSYLRIGHNDEDGLLNDLVRSAVTRIEQYLRRSLITRQWTARCNNVSLAQLSLYYGPIMFVNEVATVTRESVRTVVPATAYCLLSDQKTLLFDWPIYGYKIAITYTAGYGQNQDQIPDPIRQAIIMYTQQLYDKREGSSGIPPTALELLQPYRELNLI